MIFGTVPPLFCSNYFQKSLRAKSDRLLDAASPEQLAFLRTAVIDGDPCWIWRFTETDGTECYLSYREFTGRGAALGLSEANGLSPEQYLLAEHYDEVYW